MVPLGVRDASPTSTKVDIYIMLAIRRPRATKSADDLAREAILSQYSMHRNNIRFLATVVGDFLVYKGSLFWRKIMETDVKLFGWRDLKLIRMDSGR